MLYKLLFTLSKISSLQFNVIISSKEFIKSSEYSNDVSVIDKYALYLLSNSNCFVTSVIKISLIPILLYETMQASIALIESITFKFECNNETSLLKSTIV